MYINDRSMPEHLHSGKRHTRCEDICSSNCSFFQTTTFTLPSMKENHGVNQTNMQGNAFCYRLWILLAGMVGNERTNKETSKGNR